MRHFLLSYGNTIAETFAASEAPPLMTAVCAALEDSDFAVSPVSARLLGYEAFRLGACEWFGADGEVIKLAEITAVEAADIAAHSLTFVC